MKAEERAVLLLALHEFALLHRVLRNQDVLVEEVWGGELHLFSGAQLSDRGAIRCKNIAQQLIGLEAFFLLLVVSAELLLQSFIGLYIID